MASWRESVDETAQEDLDALLARALPFATQCLVRDGGFLPFAAGITSDGQGFFLGTEPAKDGGRTEAVIADCYAALAAQREDLRAAVVVSDVRLAGPGGDAIHLAVEHSIGFALSLVQPYTLVPGRDISLGRMSLVSGDRVTWPESAA